MPVASARDLAWDVLNRWSPSGVPAATLLDAHLSNDDLPPAERGLATELVHGVIRRQRTLDALLIPHVKRPLKQIEPGAKKLLYLGVYQLVWLSGTPDYAVVSEAVELTRRIGRPAWSGFVNGVLRSVARSLSAETTDTPAVDTVPLREGIYRKLDRAVFPEPGQEPRDFFGRGFSFPDWLVDRWARRFSFDELLRLGFWFNSPGRLSLRTNTLRTSSAQLLEALHRQEIAAESGATPDVIRLAESTRVTRLPGFAEGWFAVQDESAAAAAARLAPQPGQTVLDVCAAPGGKTAHLAALMNNTGRVIACDVNADRLALIEETCQRLGVTIVETQLVRRNTSDLPAGPFDAILIDVPCSNTGVLGKRPEVRWRLAPRDIRELAAVQLRLLQTAASRLRPGGRLVYSTCSIEPEENEQVVAAVLKACPELRRVDEIWHIPGAPGDGAYQALLISNL